MHFWYAFFDAFINQQLWYSAFRKSQNYNYLQVVYLSENKLHGSISCVENLEFISYKREISSLRI